MYKGEKEGLQRREGCIKGEKDVNVSKVTNFSNLLELQVTIGELGESDKSDPRISHALLVRHAWSLGNFFQLFSLYRIAPSMSSFIMRWFLPRERKNALRKIFKS